MDQKSFTQYYQHLFLFRILIFYFGNKFVHYFHYLMKLNLFSIQFLIFDFSKLLAFYTNKSLSLSQNLFLHCENYIIELYKMKITLINYKQFKDAKT